MKLRKVLNITVIIITVLIIIIYLCFEFGLIFSEFSNPLSNVLFNVIYLLAGLFIALKISFFLATENQKKLAIAYIRHIRTHIRALNNLKGLINQYSENIKEELHKQYFKEIKHHIDNVYAGIMATESDFKDLLDEEFKEENELIKQLIEKHDELEKKQKKLEKSSKKQSVSINKEIREIQSEIIGIHSESPIGGYAASSGSVSVNVADMIANYEPGISIAKIDPTILVDPNAQTSIVGEAAKRLSTAAIKTVEVKKEI